MPNIKHISKKLICRTFLILLGPVIIFSCEKNDLSDDGSEIKKGVNQLSKDIVIDEGGYNARFRDEFVIRAAAIENDSLQLEIEYGGGCGVVNVELITNGAFMESYPVQLHIALSFKDDDTCKALLRNTFGTNLSNLAELYRTMYHTDHDSIILHLENYKESILYHF